MITIAKIRDFDGQSFPQTKYGQIIPNQKYKVLTQAETEPSDGFNLVLQDFVDGEIFIAQSIEFEFNDLPIHSIWDNEGESLDRYTVVLNSMATKELNDCLCLSRYGTGMNEFSSCQIGKHLGKTVDFDELEIETQKAIVSRFE